MDIRPIRTEAEYQEALRLVEPYFDSEPEPGSADGDRFEVLVMLISAYEDKHYPIDPPSPVEAIKFRMDQAGLTPKDLVPMIGPINRVYEILAGSRTLTIPMIRRLHEGLGISADVLIGKHPHQAAHAA
jgi:HTH-type transcriptional regulator/antitoxin HigA